MSTSIQARLRHRDSAKRHRAGQATLEYVVVTLALVLALFSGAPNPVEVLREVLKNNHNGFEYAIALRDLPDLPRTRLQVIGGIIGQLPGAPLALQDLPRWLEWNCDDTPSWSSDGQPVCRAGPP